ncbi:MAG TPA: choice-of-anchor L domain-containing protein [Chitinophagales bacterium]|nr:choice-of-anchor L domain-containing protein [Chitinophagales bacterium]
MSAFIKSASGQLVVYPSADANALAQSLVGSGVTVFNATLTSFGNAAGKFSQTNTNLGLDSGVLLTSGDVIYAVGPNVGPSSGVDNFGPGDADLDNLSGSTTHNACILEFDLTVTSDTLKFNYVFGSDEYNDFVITLYNDIFAFFISGPGYAVPTNIALVPGTTNPTSIGNVNCGTNSQYYVCNDPWDPTGGYCTNQCPTNPGNTTLEYDGFTVPLTAVAAVQPCETYHLRLAIADAIDGIYDSGVFLKAGSLSSSSTGVNVQSSYVDPNSGTPAIIEGCFDGAFNFIITNPPGDTTYIYYIIGGTATNGVDYTQIPDSLQVLPGDTSESLVIHSFNDGITEGIETITLYLYLPCSATPFDSAVIEILDTLAAEAGPDTIVCIGNQVQLSVSDAESWLWTPLTGLSCTTCQNPLLTAAVSVTYTVTITLGGCTATDEVTIQVDNPLPVNAGPDVSICSDDSTQLNAINANSYLWNPATGLSCNTCSNPWATPTSTTTYIVTGVNSCFTTSDTVTVTVSPGVNASAFGSATVCPGDTVQLSASGGTTYSWSPPDGLSDPDSQNPFAVNFSSITYNVLVANQFGCSDTASVTINVYDIPDVVVTPQDPNPNGHCDTSIYLGNSVNLSATGGVSYLWTPSTYLDDQFSATPVSILPQDSFITYYVTVTSAEGCKNIDSVTVCVNWNSLVLVPSAFSPNKDGHNDVCRLLVRGIFSLENFYIYNRWGEIVFQTNDLNYAENNGWDGNYKGAEEPVAVYVYLVIGSDHDGNTIQRNGNVTLVR